MYHLNRVVKITKLISKIQSNFNSGDPKKIRSIISLNPVIREFYQFAYLNYKDSDKLRNEKISSIIYELQAKRDFLKYETVLQLNPLNTIKWIFQIPANILSWFGLNLNTVPSRIFSALMFVIIYLLKKFDSEIIDFVVKLVN